MTLDIAETANAHEVKSSTLPLKMPIYVTAQYIEGNKKYFEIFIQYIFELKCCKKRERNNDLQVELSAYRLQNGYFYYIHRIFPYSMNIQVLESCTTYFLFRSRSLLHRYITSCLNVYAKK